MNLTDEIPAPWKLNDTGSAFRLTDARGRVICYVYYRREEALRSEYLSREQAVEMARSIARLSRS